MAMTTDMILIGSGGHAVCVAGSAHPNLSVLFAGDSPKNTHPDAIPYIRFADMPRVFGSGWEFVIAIGNNATRRNMANRLHDVFGAELRYRAEAFYGRVISPSATLDQRAIIGDGSVVMPGATVNNAWTGRHVLINTNAVVEHDNFIDDYAHIGPNATLCGDVQIAEGAFIGAGAVVLPTIRVGAWATVGAGAVVTRNVMPGETVVGNPAKPIKEN